MEWIKKYSKLIATGIIVSLILISLSYSDAVRQKLGLAVHAGNNKWLYVSDFSAGDNLTEGVMIVSPCVYDGTNCDRIQGTATDGFNVKVTNTATTTSTGTFTVADDSTTPTDALKSASFTMGYDGAAWDMIRGNSVDGLDVKVTNASSIGGATSEVTLASAQSITGTGSETTFSTLICNHTWTVKTTGTPTSVTVLLEGSLDNTDFFTLDTSNELTIGMRHIKDKCVKYIRSNITTLSGGSTPTVTIKSGSIG